MIQYASPPRSQNPPPDPHRPPQNQAPEGRCEPDPCDPPQDPNPQDPWGCCPLPKGPDTPKIPPIDPCPEPCCCPPKPGTPGSPSSCLDDLIAEQAKQIEDAKNATQVQADLVNLKNQATDARKTYTREKYNELRDRWEKQDIEIADVIEKLVCAVKCWKCLIECEICPLLYAIRQTDIWLNGNGTLTTEVYSLRDLHYWQERNSEAKDKVVKRIKAVLDVWAKPAETINNNLTDNDALITNVKKDLATDSANAIYILFVKLLPMHLAIAPRDATTRIAAEYTSLCCCYPGTPDDCCGPDVGEPGLLQELIGPQPYIVDPDRLLDIICCIATERYLPAIAQSAAAAFDLARTKSEIDDATKYIDAKRASIAADYKANVANPIDCDDYKSKSGNGGQQNPCYPAQTPPSHYPSPQTPTGR